MPISVVLPKADGSTYRRNLNEPASVPSSGQAPEARKAYAAAHVVADPLRAASGGCALDWDATLEVRRRLWRLGLGVAEAMDTAQRGMGLSWEAVKELVARTLAAAKSEGGEVVVGVATDQLPAGPATLEDVVAAYQEQLDLVQEHGGQAVLMASRHLSACARGPQDYVEVYSRLLEGCERPVVLHWLGEAFDPQLRGYWGARDFDEAQKLVVSLISEHADRIEGIKISLLDAAREVAIRDSLPPNVRLFTGDDFNYVDLIEGDANGHSDALLGAFAAVAPVAAQALRRLDVGDVAGYRALLEPTLPLSRKLFEAPTYYYKTGVVWLAYLSGLQDHFRMVGGLESGRSVLHLVELAEMADDIGLLPDPDLAAERIAGFLRVHGIG
ncbi:dihydrodipicolinate synthase family protein [Saccharopolyspora sp. NPDC049426]|uniref:dihydrodipicolinate synthase family protein n=1 Tax=Saccharopolyspora sp. NPDC049426 TaxID=3155652 RepID=UPI0034305915